MTALRCWRRGTPSTPDGRGKRPWPPTSEPWRSRARCRPVTSTNPPASPSHRAGRAAATPQPGPLSRRARRARDPRRWTPWPARATSGGAGCGGRGRAVGAVGRASPRPGHPAWPAAPGDPPAPGRARRPVAVGAGWRAGVGAGRGGSGPGGGRPAESSHPGPGRGRGGLAGSGRAGPGRRGQRPGVAGPAGRGRPGKHPWASGAVLDVTTDAAQGPCLPGRGRPAARGRRPTILRFRQQRPDVAWEGGGRPRWPA
jgi:hypothetical protein